MKKGNTKDAFFENGELRINLSEYIINGIFIDDDNGRFIADIWRYTLRSYHLASPKEFINKILTLYKTDNEAIKNQIHTLMNEIITLENNIHILETELNDEIFSLFKLSDKDMEIIYSSFK